MSDIVERVQPLPEIEAASLKEGRELFAGKIADQGVTCEGTATDPRERPFEPAHAGLESPLYAVRPGSRTRV